MYDGPVRGGSRGGQGDFRWDDVKNSKHRENYLGATVNAPVGRWQNSRDVHWYSRDVDTDADAEEERRKEEIRRLKEQEEEALTAALGLGPSKRLSSATGESSGANSIPVKGRVASRGKDSPQRDKELRKEERAQRRAERRAKREEREARHRGGDQRSDRRYRRDDSRDRDDRDRSRSGHRREHRIRDGERSLDRGRSKARDRSGSCRRSRSRSRSITNTSGRREYGSSDGRYRKHDRGVDRSRLGPQRSHEPDDRRGSRRPQSRSRSPRRLRPSPSPDCPPVIVAEDMKGEGRAWIVDDDEGL